ncbi:MAG: hypothetical protein WAO61_02145 [Solirubrobacterales bacterium]
MPQINFKLVPLVLVAAALALVAAGCGDDDTKTASEPTPATDVAVADKGSTDEAMKDDAMKDDAMKDDAMKDDGESGAAMPDEKPGAAMKEAEAGSESGGAMIVSNSTIKSGSVDRYGKILQGHKGHSIYIFTKETRGKSECYGECAAAWPPVLTKGAPRAGSGITQSKLGMTKRTDGTTQVTYDGQPLYHFVKEKKADQVLCQAVFEFGGTWYVIDPSGKPITKS